MQSNEQEENGAQQQEEVRVRNWARIGGNRVGIGAVLLDLGLAGTCRPSY